MGISRYYNSHGVWSSLKEIKKIEKERGNCWFKDKELDLGQTKAIWVTSARKALQYDFAADFYNHNPETDSPYPEGHCLKAEWDEYKKRWKDAKKWVHEVSIPNDAICVLEDGDGGYLFVIPVYKKT